MAASRKLSGFRQLSLNCDPQRRKPVLKKQLSEDSDQIFWRKSRNLSKNRDFLKVTWEEDPAILVSPLLQNSKISEPDQTASILETKTEISKISQKEVEKTNIEIYLTQETKLFSNSQNLNCEDSTFDQVEVDPKTTPEPLLRPKQPLIAPVAAPRGRHLLRPDTLVIIPVTDEPPLISPPTPDASKRRQQFQKRTNSAFHHQIQNFQKPPLVRSSSAPTQKNSKSKKKHFLKKFKKNCQETEEKEERGEKGSEVVTMVSLISPEGSEGEEEEEAAGEGEERKKRGGEERRETGAAQQPKVMSLRKTVKSVSFQQSSIHAVRSFSASFPSRRASLIFGGALKATNKSQEKRATHQSDDDETVPKRRLVKCQQVATNGEGKPENPTKFHINVTAKGKTVDEVEENLKEKDEKISKIEENPKIDEKIEDTKNSKTQKEKQCWSLYCKMTEKGINVSFDTILRGMLTPTEYRISKMHQKQQENSIENEQDNP